MSQGCGGGECGRVFVPENRNYSIAGLLSVDDCGTASYRKPRIGIEFGARLRAEKEIWKGTAAMRGRRTNTEVSELPANVTSAGRQLEVRGSWEGNRLGGTERWVAI